MEKRLLNLRESLDVLQQQRRKIRKESLANKQAKPAQLTSLFQPIQSFKGTLDHRSHLESTGVQGQRAPLERDTHVGLRQRKKAKHRPSLSSPEPKSRAERRESVFSSLQREPKDHAPLRSSLGDQAGAQSDCTPAAVVPQRTNSISW